MLQGRAIHSLRKQCKQEWLLSVQLLAHRGRRRFTSATTTNLQSHSDRVGISEPTQTVTNPKSLKPSSIGLIRDALFEEDPRGTIGASRADQSFERDPYQAYLDLQSLFLHGNVSVSDRIESIVNQYLCTHEDGLRFVAAFEYFSRIMPSEGTPLDFWGIEVRDFLISTNESLSLPLMAKEDQKLVNAIANSFALKVKSVAILRSRFLVLYKTPKTPPWDENQSGEIETRLREGRSLLFKNKKGEKDPTSVRQDAERRSERVTGATPVFKDGAMVGPAAPELGTENEGRSFSEKIGWSTGTALADGGNLDAKQSLLRTLNAIVSRLRHLDVPLSHHMTAHMMQSASEARSTAALRHYLAEYKYALDINSLPVLDQMAEWVEEDAFAGWNGVRRKQELFTILTGWRGDGVSQTNRERDSCIYLCMNKQDINVWSRYVFVLGMISDKDAIFSEWAHVRASLQFDQAKNDARNKEDPHYVRYGPLISGIIDVFITTLVKAQGPEQAWQLYRETKCHPSVLDARSWRQLLEHPEHIKDWHHEMASPVLRKYEAYMAQIEEALGITWTGGEDGCHVVTGRLDRRRRRLSRRHRSIGPDSAT